MRPKTIILLVLALGCGLVASIGISQVLQRNQDGAAAEETSPVWVAMADIKNGDMLTPQTLKLEQWPKEKIPHGALSKLEDIDGKRTRAAIYQGEVVLEKKLSPGESFSARVPNGFRLYTVQADPVSSHGGLLQPGDRVDVMVFVAKGNGILEAGTKTVLQDIKVFAVNDQVGPSDEKTAESIAAKTVTLLMTPSQAEKCALAAEVGKIRLVMRGPNDKDEVNPAGTPLSALFTPEKTDRDVENMDHGPKTKASGLTAMLNQAMGGNQAPAGASQPVAAAPGDEQNFTMQLIRGTDVSQTDFRRRFDDNSRWENGSIGNPRTDDPTVLPTLPTPPLDKDEPKKDSKTQTPATKKDAGKHSDLNSNDSGSASHT
jgi:pilus assembly protein CpaB